MEQPPSPPLPIVDAATGLLRTRSFGRTIRGYESVPSTNTIAAAWAAEGAPEGSVVIAEYQTTGRGRMGRAWTAVPGKNLTFSIILRPRISPDQFGLVTVTAALAAAEALDRFVAPLSTEIKWPNDLLIEGRKCCGMLLESNTAGISPRAIILGIGLNVNQDEFPAELSGRATSLLLETGRMVDRAALLAALLLQLERHYDRLHYGAESIRNAFTARLAQQGCTVRFRLSETSEFIEGTVEGITETGALLLQTGSETLTFHAGEITTQLDT